MDNQITQILQSLSRNQATDQLLPAVYRQLRQMAARHLSKESDTHTLEPTALVHEAYMKLLGSIEDSWENRSHFFGAAAEAMRRILIDHARTKKRIKRGGDSEPVPLEDQDVAAAELLSLKKADDLIALDEALKKLAEVDEEKAKLVELKFFAGLKMEQVANLTGTSLRTAERQWSFA
ncbi:MAG: ECF-type sigma factor, partial [Planctomycetota bacterium]